MTKTATKERPIIFTGDSVTKILRGEKTQTRRVIHTFDRKWLDSDGMFPTVIRGGREVLPEWAEVDLVKRCPYGQVGDRMWVRETWAVCTSYDSYRGGELSPHVHDVAYKDGGGFEFEIGERGKWRSPRFIPRWASRLTLEITDIRVQRLQDISEEDAEAEGGFLGRCKCAAMQRKSRTPIEALFKQTFCAVHGTEFAASWDEKNAKRGFPWESNPRVRAITFKLADK